MKTKRITIYQDKTNKSIFINPAKDKDGKFVTKSPTRDYGSASGKNTSDEELGRKVREALEEAD